jgi:transposase-like protein
MQVGGDEGAGAMTGRVFEPAQRQAAVDEALEGKQPTATVGAKHGVSSTTLRKWLIEHYAANPEDPRRHLVGRASERYPRTDESNGVTDDAAAREDMGKDEIKRGHKIDLATRAKILKRVAKGTETKTAIAAEYGIHPATITWWESHPREETVEDPRKEVFFTNLAAGMKSSELMKKHGLSSSTVAKWKKEFKKRQQKAKKAEALIKARAAYQEKLEDPNYRAELVARRQEGKRRRQIGQSAPEPSPTPSQTLMSRPEPSPPSSLARYSPAPVHLLPVSAAASAAGAFINEAFTECVEERQTLRGMVTLLQREAEAMKRKLEQYKSRYGEI